MWTNGQRTKTNPKTSPEQSVIFQLVQEINKTNFHDDWAKNVTSRVSHVIQITGTIFQLNSRIKETNVLTKFQKHWAKNVTSRVFTCFHYIHIEKNAPPTGGHVFSPIWTIFELVRHSNKRHVAFSFYPSSHWGFKVGRKKMFKEKPRWPLASGANKTNDLINFHDDWAKIVTSRVFTSFELDRDIIGTNLLTKFHEDRTINVASRVFTNKCGRTDDGQRPVTKAQLSKQHFSKLNAKCDGKTDRRTDRRTGGQTDILTKFHENWAKNVTSRVMTCFHYIHIEKNAPPTGGHFFFQRSGPFSNSVFTRKTVPLTGGHFRTRPRFYWDEALTKFHEDRTINVASRVYTNKC
ncbi:hypothetical protein DPMN_175581 [Dreissena polymorpha]|uniref:Uncharacterized protein n=1 Tax=Dreissena polymorpha TaxID=45954 RepID=A0A9D4E8J9_DREPO|nr:hypothetical protein DPMN_175581 [Dreissena polymorpha]